MPNSPGPPPPPRDTSRKELQRRFANEETGPWQSSTVDAFPNATQSGGQDIPQQLGRYRVIKTLGQGGMGAVYLAEDVQLGRPVALKTPRFDLAAGPLARERFYREARSAASLSHPGICSVYDFGEENGVTYLTMQYIEGETLAEAARKTPFRERQAAELVCKLAEALAYAHGQGVIHRDLKPGNVLLDEKMNPVLVDFGLARQISGGGETLTRTGTVLGTPAYMSPEQAAGQTRAVGPLSDVYSLGVMLYELLTGSPPFTGSVADVQGQHLYVAPKPLSELRPQVDRRLEAICLKMLSKEPEQRFESMSRVQGVLTDWLVGRADIVEMETATGSVSWMLVVGLAMAGAVSFHLAWWFWPKTQDFHDLTFGLACISPFVVTGLATCGLAAWFAVKARRYRRRRDGTGADPAG